MHFCHMEKKLNVLFENSCIANFKLCSIYASLLFWHKKFIAIFFVSLNGTKINVVDFLVYRSKESMCRFFSVFGSSFLNSTHSPNIRVIKLSGLFLSGLWQYERGPNIPSIVLTLPFLFPSCRFTTAFTMKTVLTSKDIDNKTVIIFRRLHQCTCDKHTV